MDAADAIQTMDAMAKFVRDPATPGLNFERITGTKNHYTIRANEGHRLCLRKTGKGEFDAVDIGTHDYIYKKYG